MSQMSDILKSLIENLSAAQKDESSKDLETQAQADASKIESDAPLSAVPLQESKQTFPLEIGDEMQLLISPSYIQIDSPLRLDETMLQPFRTGQQKVILLDPRNRRMEAAILHAVDATHIVAEILEPALLRNCGDRVLSIFPCLPNCQFVLQTVVDDIDRDRVKLRYQDPRYEARLRLQTAGEIAVHFLPAELVTMIAKKQVQIAREIVVRDKAPDAREVQIADLLIDSNLPESSSSMQCFDAPPSFVGGLEDISLGGARLKLAGAHEQEELSSHHVIRLEIPLQIIAQNAAILRLKPLAVIRNARGKADAWHMHIQFLRRLPNEVWALFTHVPSIN
jgi:hypothetical protein